MKKNILCLTILLMAIFNTKMKAQAYDGPGDYKIFVGYANINGKSGAEIQLDTGISNIVSIGGGLSLILQETKTTQGADQDTEIEDFFANFNFGSFIRFHFSEPLKLSEQVDPYLGAELTFKSIRAHGGVKYNFSETLGGYIQYSQGLTKFVFSEDTYSKKGIFSAGLTINL